MTTSATSAESSGATGGVTPDATLAAARQLARAKRGSLREVCVIAYPVILTQLSITAMQLVDSAMVGRLGPTELASVGFGGIWMWTVLCFFVGSTTAVQTFVSQHHGAGEHSRCGSWAWQGLYAVTPLTALLSVAVFFGAAPLLELLAPSQELRGFAGDYIEMRSFGIVGLTGAIALSSFFRGLGDTRTPLYATLVANIVNAVLDYGLIFGALGMPQLGVAGAGLATSTAEWIYFGVLILAFRRTSVATAFQTARARASLADVRRLLRTGLPIGGQWWLEMTSFAVFTTMVARMGDVPMAATQAFIILLSVSFMQAIGLGIAVSTLVGRYIGAKDLDSADRSYRTGLHLSLWLAVGVGSLFLAAPEALLRIFTDDPEVIRMGVPLVRVGAFYQLFDAFAIIADGALRGAGDTRWPFVVRFALSWGLFLPLAWLIGIHLDGGLTGAWLGGGVYVAVLAGALLWRFRSGAWRAIEI